MPRLDDILRQLRIDAILAASALVNALFFNRRPLERERVRKVVVVETRDLGDVVLATVVLEPLRRWFPNAEIVFAIGAWAHDLLADSPLLDGIVTYTSTLSGTARGGRISPARRLREIRAIIGEHPDVVIDLRGDFGTILAAALSPARHRADRGTWRVEDIWRHLRRRGALARSHDVHEADVFAEILGLLGIPAEQRRLSLFAGEAAIGRVAGLLAAEGIGRRPLVALHPGAATAERMWEAERFGRLAEALARDRDLDFVVTGSARERHLAERIGKTMTRPAVDLCGRLRLDELTALYRRCALWIGNNTGPMHVAVAAPTAVVVLSGPTSAWKFRPYGGTSLVIEAPAGMADADAAPNAMAAISVDQVVAQIREFIASGMVGFPEMHLS